MFGEKEMLGIQERSIDEKNRIILPEYCCAEKNDHVVILAKPDYIEIWGIKEFNELMNQSKINQFTYSDEVTAFIISTNVFIDVNLRINLTKELSKKYALSSKVQIEGKGNFIRIWNKEKFKQYQEQILITNTKKLTKNNK